MLTRQGIHPLEHLAARLNDVKRVSKIARHWGASYQQKPRRTSSHNRYHFPHKLSSLKSKKKRKDAPPVVLLRKSHKRVLHDVLPHSHHFLSKRMHMTTTDQAYFTPRVALSSCDRSCEASIRIAMKHCVLQDVSFETWFSLSSSTTTLDESLRRCFDPSIAKFETSLCLTRYMMYSVDSFPHGALGPVRLWRVTDKEVRLAVHSAVADLVLESLSSCFLHVTKLPYSTFLLVGPQSNQLPLLRAERPMKIPEFSCPYTGRVFSTKEELASYVFTDKSFANRLAKDLIPLPRPTIDSSRKEEEEEEEVGMHLDFVLGKKQSSKLSARLFLCDKSNDESKRLFLHLAKHAPSIGQDDMDALLLHLHLPSFPRDYPDTALFHHFWEKSAEIVTARWNKLPRSKWGQSRMPAFRPPLGVENALVARGWEYVRDFFDVQEVPEEVLLPVSLTSPRSSKFGVRFQALSPIFLPTALDYDNFLNGSRLHPDSARVCMGTITSARGVSQENFGLGHVSALHFTRLIKDAQQRKNHKRNLFVLVKVKEDWGVAFLSLQV